MSANQTTLSLLYPPTAVSVEVSTPMLASPSVQPWLNEQPTPQLNIVCVGDKIRTIMQRYCRKNILLNFTNVGKKPPVFSEASFIAQQILSTGIEFESAEIVYNWFR